MENFYNIDGGSIEVYEGDPLFIDLSICSTFENFEVEAKQKFPGSKLNDHFRLLTLNKGYDGIRYYDPIATGEEFVLYNTQKLRRI